MTLRAIDLSRPLENGSESYAGASGVHIVRDAEPGKDGYTLSHFSHLAAHCGTHIDSPCHFIAGGGDLPTIGLPLLEAVVIRVDGSPADVDAFATVEPLAGRAILVRTGWDARIGTPGYYEEAPFLTPEAAAFLVEQKIGLLGLDSPSPDRFGSPDYPVHRAILGAGIPIVEGLVNLGALPRGGVRVWFLAFPLPVAGIEASPVRAAAILVE